MLGVLSTIRVLLADDHAMVRAGLRLVLERQSDLIVVGKARDGEKMVAHGEVVVDWSDHTELVDAHLYRGRYGLLPPLHSELTQRERDVLRLVAQGYSNAHIGGHLGISPRPSIRIAPI